MFVSGNGIANKYFYDQRSRLTDVNARRIRSAGAPAQQAGDAVPPRCTTRYDKVGNITHIVNNVSVQPWRNASVFVGPLDVTYGYDNLYQLRSMSGKYRPNVAYGYQYSDTYTYNEIGNMLTKAQLAGPAGLGQPDGQHRRPEPGHHAAGRLAVRPQRLGADLQPGVPVHQRATRTRRRQITETPGGQRDRPHTYTLRRQWEQHGRARSRGNARPDLGRGEPPQGGRPQRRHAGEVPVRRPGRTAGRSRSSAGDAWYVNQYFVLLPNNLPTKHIFAGETRIVDQDRRDLHADAGSHVLPPGSRWERPATPPAAEPGSAPARALLRLRRAVAPGRRAGGVRPGPPGQPAPRVHVHQQGVGRRRRASTTSARATSILTPTCGRARIRSSRAT